MTAYLAQSIPIDDIFVLGERRAVDDEAVGALVSSIQMLGLQTPITVRIQADVPDPDTGEVLDSAYRLVAGRHRLEACRLLGWRDIPAIVRDCDEIDAELIEIVENLHRLDLTKAQRDQHIRRYAELLKAREEAARELSRQNDAKNDDAHRPRGRPVGSTGIASKVAEQTGLSTRTVQRALNPTPKPASPPREPLLDKHGDPDMRAVAYKLAYKHTAGELQELIDHLTDILKERLGNG